MSSVPRTPPLAGDKPQPYIFLSTRGVAGRLETRYSPSWIGVPGHAFVAIAHAGWCRRTKV